MITRDPQHLLVNPVEIGSALRELQRGSDRLSTSHAGEVIPLHITEVDVRRRTMNFLPYGGERERKLLLTARTLELTGAAYGTPIEFLLRDFHEIEEFNPDGPDRLVIQAPFPQELYRMQRRQFFRAPVAPPNTRRAVWRTPKGQALTFRIQDISLSGIGLRIESNTPDLPAIGALLHPVQLDFEEYGNLSAWLQVVTCRTVEEFDTRRGYLYFTHLGCIFAEPDGQRESFLQRLTFALEKNTR